MRLIVFVILGSILLSSCAGAPVKPQIELCVLNVIKDSSGAVIEIYGDCGLTDGEKINVVSDMNIENLPNVLTDNVKRPVSEMDKNICQPPWSWERLQNYVDSLVNYIETRCAK